MEFILVISNIYYTITIQIPKFRFTIKYKVSIVMQTAYESLVLNARTTFFGLSNNDLAMEILCN